MSCRYQVQSCQSLSDDIVDFALCPVVPDASVAFVAGQYVWLSIAESDIRLPFTIASAPVASGEMRFLFRIDPHVEGVQAFHEHLLKHGDFMVSNAEGTSVLQANTRPLLMVVGGTGISQAIALCEALSQMNSARPVKIFASIRQAADLVLFDCLPAFIRRPEASSLSICLSRPDTTWQGDQGYAYEAVMKQQLPLASFDVYMSGPYAMVYDTITALAPYGLSSANVFTDMLSVAEVIK